MDMLVTYMRREPTTEPITRRDFAQGYIKRLPFDVQSYRDPEAKEKGMGRWPWHYLKSKPTRRNRYITLGCMRHHIVWLPDLES